MIPCPACRRHLRASELRCPFCDTDLGPGVGSKFLHAAGSALALFVLSACYGPPDGGSYDTAIPTLDTDEDGFVGTEDCDEGNAAIHAGAPEDCTNGLDDDCDELVDTDDDGCGALP